jgi:hypothetical protein
MSVFARDSICDDCNIHFNTDEDCYRCNEGFCKRDGDDLLDGDDQFFCGKDDNCECVEILAGDLSSLGFSMLFRDETLEWVNHLEWLEPETLCNRKKHVWPVRAVEEAFRRLGVCITFKTACLMVHQYLPANAKTFKTTPFPQTRLMRASFWRNSRSCARSLLPSSSASARRRLRPRRSRPRRKRWLPRRCR